MWLSYVIPLYNCGKYIAKCLDSILTQGLEPNEYEVIVVNDGSTDNGSEIVAQYCQKYDNFRLINKENGGVSSARNRGIDEACGEYIFFMDADDYLLADGMKTLRDCYLHKYGHPDMVSFHFYEEDDKYNAEEYGHIRPHENIFHGTFLELGNKLGISNVVYTQIISRELIVRHNIRFKPYIRAQDTMFMYSLFEVTGATVVASDLNIYRYVVRYDGAVRKVDRKHIERSFHAFLDIADELREMEKTSPYPKTVYEKLMRYMQMDIFTRILHARFSYKDIKRIFAEASRKNFYPIEDNGPLVYRFINMAYRCPFLVYCFSFFYRYIYLNFMRESFLCCLNKVSKKQDC